MSRSLMVTSVGLWRQRRALSAILDAPIMPLSRFLPGRAGGFVGWGGRPSAERALMLSAKTGKPLILCEDGFLMGFRPGGEEPRHAYVIDRSGIYFDRRKDSDLRRLIEQAPSSGPELARARRGIELIRAARLSKYNNAPSVSDTFRREISDRPAVLLVDQVPGDASIPPDVDYPEALKAMLSEAASDHPDALLLIKAHPAHRGTSRLIQSAQDLGIDHVAAPACNVWDLLEMVQAVYTISSHLGFEGLMAGRAVTTFGAPFYAGWGLTRDHLLPPADASARRSLEQLFAAAYLHYSRYLDVHSGEPCSFEHAVEQLRLIRDHRMALGQQVVTMGFSPWRRRVLQPFLAAPGGPPVHCPSLDSAQGVAREQAGTIALWGADAPAPSAAPYIRIEDGFIRSLGLGADLHAPLSICIDGEHLYFDSRGPSRLETLLREGSFDPPLLERAQALRQRIIDLRLTKYNPADSPARLPQSGDRLRILIPGQVVNDASIRFGGGLKDNAALVAAVREAFPDAFLVFRPHPDVSARLRDGGPLPERADHIATDGSILDWIDWCERVETISSLAGFEALIRGKPVGTHGTPFYAGWGLTEDRLVFSRRNRKVDQASLIAAALILYPAYVHPASGLPCTVEDAVTYLSTKREAQVRLNFRHLARRAFSRGMRLIGVAGSMRGSP